MKQLQELLKGKVVNCQTEEEAKEFLEIDIVCERIERNIELLTKIIGSYGK
jgi:hypothetical protein